MKEFKGTKGEWRYSDEFQCITVSKKGVIEGSKTICDISTHVGFDYSGKEFNANARLIAAAPVLLKEHLMDLKHLKTWRSELVNAGLMGSILWNEYTDMIDSKEKAINKALN